MGMETWGRLYRERHVAESSLKLPFMAFSEDDLILDIGCGTGKQMNYIESTHSCNCIGIDLIPANKPNIHVADALHLPFSDSTFDASYSLGVVEHTDTEKAIRESIRVTKPGGSILHSVPNTYSLHTLVEKPLTNTLLKKWTVGYEQSFTPRRIKHIFTDCGLIDIQQRITTRANGDSELYKLSRAESFLYKTLKRIDNSMAGVLPWWGFFIFTYGEKPRRPP